METLWYDFRFALLTLRRAPGFSVVVVLVLALSMAANTAVFSIVNAVLLRPLPFKDPGRVMQILTRKGSRSDPLNNMQDCAEIQKRNHVFEEVAPISPRLLLDTGGDEPQYLGGARVPACFFNLLGVQPAVGRGFRPEEERPGDDYIVVLSHEYWTRRYNANPDVIGQNIVLQEGIWARKGLTFTEGVYTVIGVMPPGFWCLDRRDVWMPLVLNNEGADESKANQSAYLVGRLQNAIRREQAQAELDVIGNQLRQERPQPGADRRLLLVSPHERFVADVRRTLWFLLSAVGFVLLIACANVANMMLARSLGRQREMAIRLALGARRPRLIRQFLTESLLLSLTGGLCGLLLVVCLLGVVRTALPYSVSRMADIRIDGCVFGFVLMVSVLVGTMIGLVPILGIADLGTGRILQRTSLTIHGGETWRRVLLVIQVALSLILLIGAGLMIRSFSCLTSLDLGFDPRNVWVANVNPEDSLYPQPQVYFPALLDRVKQLPGVQTVGLGCLWLFGTRAQNTFSIPGRDTPPNGQEPSADVIHIGGDYFQVLRIPLLQGRFPMEDDRVDTEPVAVVNEAFARHYFADVSPVGQAIMYWSKVWQIIGVVADVRPNGFRSDITPTMYLPYQQVPKPFGMRLIVRTDGTPSPALKPLRQAILSLAPNRPIEQISTINEMLDRQTAAMRFSMQSLSLLAVLALILAAVGTYGLMTFFVSRHTQEICIRMALGARSTEILRSVVGQGLKLTLIGTVIGLAGAFALTRLISSLLYDVSPTDPVTFASVPLVLVSVATLASYLPARRAARLDPMAALRYE